MQVSTTRMQVSQYHLGYLSHVMNKNQEKGVKGPFSLRKPLEINLFFGIMPNAQRCA